MPQRRPRFVFDTGRLRGPYAGFLFQCYSRPNQLTGACSAAAFSSARNITIGGNFNGVSGSPDSLYTGAIYTSVYTSAWPSATDRRKVWDWHANISALTFTGLPSAGGYRRPRDFSDMTGGF